MEDLKNEIWNIIAENILDTDENNYEKMVKLESYTTLITRLKIIDYTEIIKITLEAMNIILKDENKKEED